jgi:predicted dehydrogenase
VAAIGCGYWGKNLVRNFAELRALAAICDLNRAAAEELADRYHAPVAEFTVGCGCDRGETPSQLRSEG